MQSMQQKVASNALGRDYVVGDIHGNYDRLFSILRSIDFNESIDRLFSVGDLIDRGPDSERCLKLLELPWFFAVLRNHEEMLLNAVADPSEQARFWFDNGGGWSRALPQPLLAQYAQRLSQLPLVITVGEGAKRFNIFHAEFFGEDPQLDQGHYQERVRDQLLWGRKLIRTNPKPYPYPGLSLSFCGHTQVTKPTRIGSQVFIDTGCGFEGADNRLTVVDVLKMKCYVE